MLLDALTRGIRCLGPHAALSYGAELRVVTPGDVHPHLHARTPRALAVLLLAELRLRPRFDLEARAIRELRFALDVQDSAERAVA